MILVFHIGEVRERGVSCGIKQLVGGERERGEGAEMFLTRYTWRPLVGCG